MGRLTLVFIAVIVAGAALWAVLTPQAETDAVSGVEAGEEPSVPDEQPPSEETDGLGPTASDASATTQPSSTSNPAPSATSGGQPASPIRAAFFYPWFPDAWDQGGMDPFTNFTPSLGRYDTMDTAVIDEQLALARDAGIEAFIASWWGAGHHTDQALGTLLRQTTRDGSPNPDLRWAIYYEEEGQSDPRSSSIAEDLRYLRSRYFALPGYLRVDGKPVVFVWADRNDAQGMVDRWAAAEQEFGDDVFVVLKVFNGYESAQNQPDSWHQYEPASPYSEHLPHSVAVSPGFWLAGEAPRLGRDLSRFASDVERMNESGAFWHLITSWNEWAEGTSVEPADEFGTTYIDVLAGRSSSSDGQLQFTAGGDIGASADTEDTMASLAKGKGAFFLALGDLSYSDLRPESAWCEYIKAHLGSSFPVQLIVGNHEDDDRPDGFIGEFTKCLPDRMGAKGTYGTEYYFDANDLVRIIMIGADTVVDGVEYDYEKGTAHYAWLSDTIDSARASGIPWVIVGMHKTCISAGRKPCEVGEDLAKLLIEKRVDLVLSGHDHNYQRSHQLGCITVESYSASCVTDDGADGVYERGNGTVFVIAGLIGGSSPYRIDGSDPEYSYFASTLGAGDAREGRGYLSVDVTASELVVTFIGTTTSFSDRFSVG